MAKNNNLTDFLTGVADAIRTKKGTTDLINPQDFESEILSIQAGGSTEKQYTVRVYDYDGTILLETTGKDGDIINLPEVPTHEKLAFQEWACSKSLNEDENSVTINGNDIAVGAVYSSASGNHEFDIRLTKKTGLSVTLNLNGTKDWGDGTSDETNTHTYSDYGDYTISVSGSVQFSNYVMNQSFNTPNYTLMNVRLGIHYNVSSNSTFSNCLSLSTITIPRSYNTRNPGYDFSFGYCYSLKHLTIEPGGNVDNYKFRYCYAISSVVITNVIMNTVKNIGSYAFENCYCLTSITIPDGVTSINSYAFNDCTGLTSIAIPSSVTSINSNAFYGCGLTSITIPDSVTSIGSSAFRNCSSLTSIAIPDSVTSIGSSAFYYCRSLTSVNIPNGVTSIGDTMFSDCTGLTSITIPDSVTSIGSSAFRYCRSLTSITIPDSVTSIGNSAFDNCTGLTSITIGNGVASIKIYTFRHCSSLTSIAIPDSVTSFEEYVLGDCYSCLEYNFSNSTQVPTISNANVFSNINQAAKIIVPDSLYDTWITSTNWVDLADYIYKVSEVQEV